MRKVKITKKTEITIYGIKGFFIKKVTRFGTGAKINCPKKYLGRKVYVVIK